MRLWTVQPVDVYEDILKTGLYRCDKKKMVLPELIPYYDWMVKELKKKIGDPPEGVEYPVWAIHTDNWKHKRLDLRSVRWRFGKKGDRLACIEVEIPDIDVVLSDYDAWSIILVNGLITKTKEESDKLDDIYENLPEDEKTKMKEENWQKLFDVSVFENEWITRGKNVQAAFWELKKEQMVDVRYFTGCDE